MPRAWWPSKAIVSLKDEVNARWPARSKVSDGIIGDARHQHEPGGSDHNPRADGEVCAFDITCAGIDDAWLAERLRSLALSGDKRIGYVIHDRRIFNPSVSAAWRPYKGDDPHTKHIHLSVTPHSAAGPWGLLVPAHANAPAKPAPTVEDDDMGLTADEAHIRDAQFSQQLRLTQHLADQMAEVQKTLAGILAALKAKP